MEEKHRTILRLNWCNIRDNLEPNNILPKLVLVLRETDEEEIRQQSTRQERCDKLLHILPTRGENAFNVFVNALVKEAPHLAKKLTKADMQTEGEIIKAREQSAKFRTKIRKLNAELDAEIDNHMKTLKELEKLKSLHGKENEGKEEEITPDGLQQKEIREGGDQRRLREMPGQSKNQTLEKEIQELKKSEDNQGERQPLQKKLQLVSWELEPANEEQPQQMGRPREMYKELDDKVTNGTSELKELLAEIIQQHRADESCSRCATVRNERNSTITEIQTLRNEIQELKKEVRKISKDYQPNTQTPHKWHPSPQENPGHLSQEHKAVNVKKLQEEIKDLQKKNKKLEDLEKSKEKLEKDLLKSQKDLEKLKNYFACENERVKEYQQKLEKESKAKDDLLEQKLKDETQIKEENTSLQEKLKEEISKSVNLKKEVHRLRLTPNEMPGQIYSYSEDFDKRGVIYHLATMYGKTSQVNPSSTQIVVTRSSDREGHAEDLLKNQVKRGTVSGTKEKEGSSWCVDLTEKYVLYLTHYTLRHGRERSISVLLNWRLEGSLDGNRWKPLKTHKNDHGLKKDGSYCTCTWVIEGRSNAFRYFRIVQTGVNSSGRFGIFLSGIELYGVLIEKNS